MAVARTVDLVDALRALHLLEPTQQDQVAVLQAGFPEPRGLARELLQRDWLTAYQVNQLFQGRGPELLLGSYVLLERLGEGGMGAVFKARNWKLGRVVALKLIRKEHLKDAEVVARFRREIRAAARLCHPNIVQAHDADEVSGSHFLIMEYVEGIDLGRLVEQRGPLPVADACACVCQAALGLQHAFEQGLVHRDIKPSNLLLAGSAGRTNLAPGDSGVVKILDLGLALLQPTAEDLTSTLTSENVVMGTPDFMAPEQTLDSHAVDIRADLYSLGCTLYFLLTGQVPFPGGTVGQKIARHLAQEPVPVEQMRPDVPPAVAAVVRKLLAKQPEDRYQTPAGLAAVLQFGLAASAGPPAELALVPTVRLTRAPAPSRRSVRRRLLAGIAGALLLGGGGLALFGFLGRDGSAGSSGEPTSPDPAPLPGRRPLALTSLDKAEIGAEDLAAAGLSEPQQAPEGLIAVLGDCREGGKRFATVAWSPDGRLLAAAGEDGIIRLWQKVQGGEPRLLSPKHSATEDPAISALAFSPKGLKLASGGNDYSVRLWNPGSGEDLRPLPRHGRTVRALAWSPDGNLLASGSLDGKVGLWDVQRSSDLGRIEATRDDKVAVFTVAVHPEGRVLASGHSDGVVKLWDVQTRQELSHTIPKQKAVYFVAFSPDGRLLAIADTSPTRKAGNVLLWDWAQDRKVSAWLAHNSAITGLAWRAGGQVLATAGSDGTVRLWNVPAGTQQKLIPVGPAGSAGLTWLGQTAFSPDGRYLATANGNGTVYILRLTP